MTVFAFVNTTTDVTSVIMYAAWAATTLNQPLVVATKAQSTIDDMALEFDVYQHMDARQDAFSELVNMPRQSVPGIDTAAVDLAQVCAIRARELGVERVRTTTFDSLPWFIEANTDSGDLLVVSRHSESSTASKKWQDQFLNIHRRMILAVPEGFVEVRSWLFAIDGKSASGRAVDYLCRTGLLQPIAGISVIVGNEHKYRTRFRDAVKHLQSSGYQVAPYELHGSADDVLAAVLTVLPSDLLILGSYDQGRVRSLIERSTTSRLLREFRGPVLIARA